MLERLELSPEVLEVHEFPTGDKMILQILKWLFHLPFAPGMTRKRPCGLKSIMSTKLQIPGIPLKVVLRSILNKRLCVVGLDTGRYTTGLYDAVLHGSQNGPLINR